MEILNRREQIGVNSIPPEIPDPDTLVTKTDYATASKSGVVKIGNNINVSNGKISVPAASDETVGVVKIGENLSVDENGFLNADAGGVTCDELWTGTTSTTATDITESLAHPISDYKLIVCYLKGTNQNDAGFILPYMGVSTYRFTLTKTIDLYVTENAVTIKNEGSGALSGVTIVGIK